MVYGTNTSVCAQCGKPYITGDCIDLEGFCSIKCEELWKSEKKEVTDSLFYDGLKILETKPFDADAKIINEIPSSCLVFYTCGEEIIKLCPNGEFFVRGEKVTEDQKLYEAFVNFLTDLKYYK
jgi:endogenous inhibitor of DNA gyrase (YacG/DUF329 family)